jgi:predicted ATP-dependent protease
MESTAEVKIPSNPIDAIIGQEEAVSIARLAAIQRRHLLLVGPPGCGKSLIAQAMAFMLPKPNEEIAVCDNPENPERPILEIRTRAQIEREGRVPSGVPVNPSEVPIEVAERLGFRCRRCGARSRPDNPVCVVCGADKYKISRSPFDDLLFGGRPLENKVVWTRRTENGEEKVLYERVGNEILFYNERALIARERELVHRKIIVPLERKNFVQATGASETELLGDVRHDPYGGHSDVGVKPYKRVVPGAIHEAHEGVLFIDEMASLGHLQRYLLTAMQEKKFPIVGRNPTSSGAAVRVDGVPCDFILVGAVNFSDLDAILPALRSRIVGNGYEILLNTVMADTPRNRKKMIQFIAQEIRKDGRIPHAHKSAVDKIIYEARRMAKIYDGKEGLTLRLRSLAGILKLAGDIAISEGSELILDSHVESALSKAKSAEQQAESRYGITWRSTATDKGVKKSEESYII